MRMSGETTILNTAKQRDTSHHMIENQSRPLELLKNVHHFRRICNIVNSRNGRANKIRRGTRPTCTKASRIKGRKSSNKMWRGETDYVDMGIAGKDAYAHGVNQGDAR